MARGAAKPKKEVSMEEALWKSADIKWTIKDSFSCSSKYLWIHKDKR